MRAVVYDRYGSPGESRPSAPTSPGGAEPYDRILDLVAHRSVFAYRRALARGGRYRCVGGSVPTLIRVVTVGAIVGRLTDRRIGMPARRR